MLLYHLVLGAAIYLVVISVLREVANLIDLVLLDINLGLLVQLKTGRLLLHLESNEWKALLIL